MNRVPPDAWREATREAQLVALWREGKHTTLDLAEMFDVARSAVYRAIRRAAPADRQGSTATPN